MYNKLQNMHTEQSLLFVSLGFIRKIIKQLCRQPGEEELEGARYQGRRIAETAMKLHG